MNDNVIDSFTEDFFFLSNFFLHPIKYEGYSFPSTEHAYQAAKVLPENRDVVWARHTTCTAGQSKRLGKQLSLRPDWEDVKERIMEEVLRIKFQDPDLRLKLKATHPKELIEGNNWGDREWGTVDGVGKNKLGKLLMKIRMEIILNDAYHTE